LAGKPNEGTLIMIVIGVDPHKRSHTAAAVEASTGELLGSKTVAAREQGHGELVRWARFRRAENGLLEMRIIEARS
jgi:hypothetical protein